MIPPDDFEVYVGPVITGDVDLRSLDHFDRAAYALRLFHLAERRGAKGRRARRKLVAWLVGARSRRGDRCPYRKLSYQRMWARGLEHSKCARHVTFRPRDQRTRPRGVWRWFEDTARRSGPLRFDLGIDASPAIDALNAIRRFMRSHIPPANPMKECPPPCP